MPDVFPDPTTVSAFPLASPPAAVPTAATPAAAVPFTLDGPGAARFWTCVRTRPRWEKRFAEWLSARRMGHFLPLVARRQGVAGKGHRNAARVFEHPLLPGYVFVEGDRDKAEFRESNSVVYLIKPQPFQAEELHRQLWGLWKGLESGSHLELARELKVGQAVEVTAGPLKGVRGRFERWAGGGRLILTVDVLGVGAVVEVDDGCVVVPI
jgi:transcription antitermination factor NusG